MNYITKLSLLFICFFSGSSHALPEKAAKTPMPCKTMGQNALIEAARKGHEETAKKALSSVSPNIATSRGVTPLMFASYFGYTNMVKILLAHKAQVNPATVSNLDFSFGTFLSNKTSKTTALMLAAYAGKLEIVYQLLKSGAHVNAQDSNAQTALVYCIMGDPQWPHRPLADMRKRIIQLLLEFGADAHIVDSAGLDAAYYYSCVAGLVQSFGDSYEKDQDLADRDELLQKMRSF
jgi:ankyrin repeat protein